jgi:hypothetical protein
MPRTTVISTQTLATPNVEVVFATLTPTFDRLNVYVDMAPLKGVPVTWRLYATTSGIKTLIAEVPNVTYNLPLDPISGGGMVMMNDIETIAADTYQLVGVLDYYVTSPISVKAGVIGFDAIVNDAPPEVNATTLSLVYAVPQVYAVVTGVHTHFQAELDLTALGTESTSAWTLYGTINDAPLTITAPLAKQNFNPASSQTSIFFQKSSLGADSVTLAGASLVNDPAFLAAHPIKGSLSGFSDTLDGTGGGGGITQLTQDVLAGPGAGSQAATVAQISRSALLVGQTAPKVGSASQSVWEVYQPDAFSNPETYTGGAAFSCDAGSLATTLIECNFAGGAGGTVLLPSPANAGRVLHIADINATISLATPLVLQPAGGVSVGGGAPGAPLTITTTGWAQKIVLNSAGNNWMIF